MPVRRTLLAGPVLDVAPKLLGMMLRRTTDEGTVAVRLTEVEAYDGANDPGSHAYRGETPRTAVMFGPPGHLYVYFTYGMHFCMNVVAGPDGKPSAVLLRAGEVVEGIELARERRGFATPPPHDAAKPRVTDAGRPDPLLATPASTPRVKPHPDRDLARGPARMCVALGIARESNGIDLLARGSAVQLLPGPGFDGAPATGPRVGLRDAPDWPWRFWIPGDPTVSPYKPHMPKKRV
ncbi:DNA-3-methyladenine glycosylase [Kribbella sp. CA-293567]|uniref:DNA-3-methyladenine glycosylase n=1 Tax=Kribbella sp. CA-293567 TaxID=3002436 RepID=UPI0022DDFBCC|nr:DNA-3-methyladenine glycosylase [Kribbella sp. CA-293567]WBQ07328.1 DNA-3-methyladenine glycosylase [Kribbella sp. CA-293567]